MAMFCIIFLCVASSLCLANSQAPGDGDQFCIDHDQHPVYDDNVHPLMDTRDYIQLLPDSSGENGVWQTLDKDENNPAGGYKTEWKNSKGNCMSAPEVCGHLAGPQNNWMISQHISRQVLANESVPVIQIMFDLDIESCLPSSSSCVETLSLYVWETSTPNATSAADTENYHFIANINSEYQDLTIDFSSSYHTGFYLAIRDNGTCAIVNPVLVYYTTCWRATVGLVRVNETVFNSSNALQGECVADSVAIHERGPLLVCSERGKWSVVNGCECTTQHYMDSSGQQCIACPANSEAPQTGLTECPCVQDYYRADDEGPSVVCTQSPSAPVNVTVSNMTNTSAILSWTPPQYSGGRDFEEITYTVTYSALHDNVPVRRVPGVTPTEIELTGLVPFLNYTFFITAENAVSSQDTNINTRTTKTTITTLEGVAAMVTGLKITVGDDVILSWGQPDPPHGIILYYNIKITELKNMYTTVLTRYTQTSITKSALTHSLNVTYKAVITVQVQAVTRVGAGEYSDTLSLVVGDKFNSMSMTAVALVSSLVPLLFIFSIITVLLIFIVVKYRKKTSQLCAQTTNDKEIEIVEYASTPIIAIGNFTLAPALPRSPPPCLHLSQNVAYGSTQFTTSTNTCVTSSADIETDPIHNSDSDDHSEEVVNHNYGAIETSVESDHFEEVVNDGYQARTDEDY